MIYLSACHTGTDTHQSCAGAHLFLIGGQAGHDTQKTRAAGQPFNTGRAMASMSPIRLVPALPFFTAAGHASTDTQRKSASGNLLRSPANRSPTPK